MSNTSPRRSTGILPRILAASAAVAVCAGVALPAAAHDWNDEWEHRQHREWREHERHDHEWREHWREGPPVVYERRGPVVVYERPPVVYERPPVIYAPPPVVAVPEPGIGVYLNLR